MFGTWRYILAILVLISHAISLEFNLGVFAVINFLIISGYLNANLLEKYYSIKNVKLYYFDRFLRIAPQFYFYFILIIIINYKLNIFDFKLIDVLTNFSILPLGYYLIFDNLFSYDYKLMIPPTWTLGLELTFYLIFPYIIFRKKIDSIFFLSFLVFVIAFSFQFYNRAINYTLLPGTLFIFLIGAYAYYEDIKKKKFILTVLLCLVLMLMITIFNKEFYKILYNKEVISGIIVGSLLINIKKYRSNKIDFFLGNLSYGIYLNHFICLKILSYYFNLTSFQLIIFAIIISSLLSFLSYYYIEIFFNKLRKKNRYKN